MLNQSPNDNPQNPTSGGAARKATPEGAKEATVTTTALAVRGGNGGGPTIIESASATTSPDNANSGYAAYLITALALVGVLFLSMGAWSCGSSLIESGVRNGLNSIAQQWGEENGAQGLLDGQNGAPNSHRSNPSNGSSLSVSDALGLDLDLYDETIASTISAGDYAGTPNSMRSYVLSVVHADSDHNSALVAHLNAAEAADDPRSDVEAALAECDQAISDLNALQAPTDLGEAVGQAAQAGRDKAVARWQAIQAELKLLDTQDEVSYNDLKQADSAIEQATEDAGTALVQALSQATEAR